MRDSKSIHERVEARSPQRWAAWCDGQWSQQPGFSIHRVVHDSRAVKPGDFFVALKGDRFDAHTFLPDVIRKGAIGALVEEPVDEIPCLVVADTLVALQQIAAHYRQCLNAKVIGISGSAGKTTVKEMLSGVLSKAGITYKSPGNWNNHIGVPLTLINIPQDADYAVIEIGINQPGEMQDLASWVYPDWALLTEIGTAHREHFSSQSELVREKIRLLESVRPSGSVLIDADNEWAAWMRDRTVVNVVEVAFNQEADYRAMKSTLLHGMLEVYEKEKEATHAYRLPYPGNHMARNALKVIGLCRELHVSPPDIFEALVSFKNVGMRWQETHLGSYLLINDAYNANPESMCAVMHTFSSLPGLEKWVVLGDMLELGDLSKAAHEQVVQYALEMGFQGILLIGKEMCRAGCGYEDPFLFCLPDVEKTAAFISENVPENAQILIKGSRSMALERIITHLEKTVKK